MLAFRAKDVAYYNTTGKPIVITIVTNTITTLNGIGPQLSVNGVTVTEQYAAAFNTAYKLSVSVIVQPNSFYKYSVSVLAGSDPGIYSWYELR
jgi:hypothetical protein